MSIYGDDKHNVHSEYVSPVNKYAVDIPNINHIRLGNVEEWTNVGVFKTKEEAIKWAQENLGADENGMICVISSF